ncbi:MAG: hypothetical protein CMD46_04670 [Gammaproteobacteria bacterium]|nr:hypothetical protein [Gammaproteobacteria bacterium]|tara:strand:+ start:5459 stop:6103 length:645 start_codon:yes stop_codon:yes gene_type:complete
MNDIYDNNMRFLPLLKFLDKNKKIIISLLFISITASVYFVITNQISKQNNNNAAKIYKDFLIEMELENKDIQKIDDLIKKLLKSYPKTGYSQVALLKKASMDANNKDFESALENYLELILVTNGFNGNKTFNKLARVNSARIYLANEEYESALKMIEKYSSSSTNAFIHELTGDILVEKNKTELALAQYEKASEKYTDDTSKLIISMKIANLGI